MPKTNSEIRKAYYLNKFVLITPGRAKRPRDMMEQTIEKSASFCPFCPGKIEKDLIIKFYGGKKNWKIAAIKNKFPSVSPDNEKAYGMQEVIVETRAHNKKLVDLPESHFVYYLNVLADRLKDLSKNKRLEYILEFKNHGSKAGASIKHEHSQIFATEILPVDVFEELKLAQSYKIEHGTCPYCDILKKELKSRRKVWEDKYVGAFTPYAPEYHYETWIFPKRHSDNISTLNQQEIKSLAKCLKFILNKVNKLGLAYNFFMHQVVSAEDQHFYIKIQPRDINVWAGVELGSGLIINSVSPEESAKYLRKK
jgi:UDPglucose--hexose-1-phosphate uridylyltransferase